MVARRDLTIDKGSTFRYSFVRKYKATGLVVDMTGYTARMQIRQSYAAETPLAELTTENGGIVIDGAAGRVSLYLSNTATAAITATAPARYDVELIAPNGDVTRFVEGAVLFTGEVTR